MLNIYLGRESLNKEKFMYESIKAEGTRTIVLVPDQYSLEAEGQAFKYLQTEVLLDIEITGFSRLGSRLVKKYGRKDITRIDEYGRQMILTKILLENEKSFRLFGSAKSCRSCTFVQLVNDFITDAKLANIVASDFDEILKDETLPDMLRDKLSDLQLIFSKYEEAVCGKLVDSEDYISLYTGFISQDTEIKSSEIWIYGFDSFTPKNIDVIIALCTVAKNVNIVLTDSKACRDEELFTLGRMVTSTLCRAATDAGCKHEIHWVDDSYTASERPCGIRTIERELFAMSREPSDNSDGITLVKSSNIYSEIESAASHVLELLSSQNLRYRDIAIICNDQSERLSVIKRTFEEYGIRLFDDSKRSILNSPTAVYLISVFKSIENGYRAKEILTAAKTGLLALSEDEVEDIELYADKYRIRGKSWKKPFTYGAFEYGEDGLAELESIRARLMKSFEMIEDVSNNAETMREFVVGCYNVLATSDFIAGIEKIVLEQRAAGLNDVAEETEQIWAKIIHAFDQIAALMGEQPFDLKMFTDIFESGLAGMNVGVIPPTSDEIILGTMQRTRVAGIKAMLVLGANEGLLPLIGDEDLLFSPEEAALIQDKLMFGDRSSVMSMEEKMAIYRNLSKPLESLWISYATAGTDGKELKPSEIIYSLKKIFPMLKEHIDVVSEGKASGLIGGKINTVRHMTQMLSFAKDGSRISGDWKVVKDWIAEKYAIDLERVVKGLYFDFRENPISAESAKKLYQRGSLVGTDCFTLSPSRLERFSRCPFSHFISYGLRPKEERVYEAGSREIGDVHHEVMAFFADYLTKNSLWNDITRQESDDKVREIMEGRASEYKEALFRYTSLENYKLRRALDVACESCWALIEHYRAGKIKESSFEIAFGRNCPIKPIEINTSEGRVYIEGKIDRLDILPDDSVKIIDYKTGNERFRTSEVYSGYRLQLMLYLKAAEEGVRKPAGAFYFLIGDPNLDASAIEKDKIFEEISKELKNFFKLNGIIVDGADTVRNIAGEFDNKSSVLSISVAKDGSYKGNVNNCIMTPQEFSEFEEAFSETINNLCSALVSGDISISPKDGFDRSPCDYCQFKSICRYDLHKKSEIRDE